MSQELNQTIAEASLDNLHDIIVPPAIGIFPLAQGWYIVLLLLLALLFHFAYKQYELYQKEQYRRDAKTELKALSSKNRANSIALLELAKRVAISAYSRESIAKLHGSEWWDFMQEHSKVVVSSELRTVIDKLLYEENVSSDETVFDSLYLMVSEWIKTHRVTNHV